MEAQEGEVPVHSWTRDGPNVHVVVELPKTVSPSSVDLEASNGTLELVLRGLFYLGSPLHPGQPPNIRVLRGP